MFHFDPTDLFARLRACFTDIGARSADRSVQRRLARHEIRRGLANLDAICHQLGVILLHMPAAFRKAVIEEGRLAFGATGPALIDAILQLVLLLNSHKHLHSRG
jgi:hypothetical protein